MVLAKKGNSGQINITFKSKEARYSTMYGGTTRQLTLVEQSGLTSCLNTHTKLGTG